MTWPYSRQKFSEQSEYSGGFAFRLSTEKQNGEVVGIPRSSHTNALVALCISALDVEPLLKPYVLGPG
jgi:hypothetical protein